jgi:hypothetical protein
MRLADEAIELINQQPLSEVAVRAQATYLLGAQTDYLGMLEESGIKVGRINLPDPEDPENPAEFSWRLSYLMHEDFLRRERLPSTSDRFKALITASIFVADDTLYHITKERVPLVVPRLYREHLPKTFGRLALLFPRAA